MTEESTSLSKRLAVCSWSLQPANPEDLLNKLEGTGVRRLQLAMDPLCDSPDVWGGVIDRCRARGVEIVSGMFGSVGEDYSTLESIRCTGGFAPDGTWEENLRHVKATVELATQLGLRLLTFHAGFLPENEEDEKFAKVEQRVREAADIAQRRGLHLALETGQETASDLRRFLERLARPNLGVNFDPANMILYDKGDPIVALRTLGPWVRQIHLKDAVRTKTPGEWGQEVPLGEGQVDWNAFFRTLQQINFSGDLVIEREAGEKRVEDVRKAREMVEEISVH